MVTSHANVISKRIFTRTYMYNKSVFFPCVVLFKNGDFNACSNEVSLSSYSEIFIDNGSLDYAKVIDIYGNMFFIDNTPLST